MSRIGEIVTKSFSRENASCPMSAIRVMNKYHEWSEPILGVDKVFFINLLLTDTGAENDFETYTVINDGKITAKRVGKYKSTELGLIIPEFVDAANGEIVSYDAIETISLEKCYLQIHIEDLFAKTSEPMKKMMCSLLELIEGYAGIPTGDDGDNYRIIFKFCNI